MQLRKRMLRQDGSLNAYTRELPLATVLQNLRGTWTGHTI